MQLDTSTKQRTQQHKKKEKWTQDKAVTRKDQKLKNKNTKNKKRIPREVEGEESQ